jgi:ABC-type glycerol-3-phosphate transport system substrate-binding protein
VAWKYAPEVAFDYGGHRRAVPFSISSDKLYYRTDLVEKAPATWAEMVDTGKRLMAEKKVRWGFVGGWRYLHSWNTLFWAVPVRDHDPGPRLRWPRELPPGGAGLDLPHGRDS